MKTTNFNTLKGNVSVVGMGGEGILRTYGKDNEAQAVIKEALAQGITYFDSAKAYSDSERYYGKIWGKNPDLRQNVFQTSKSAARDKKGALVDLQNSFQRLQTSYLDLWQIHDIRTDDDFRAIARPGGALEAFVEAREQGLVKAIGVTGHHDPYILTRALKEWPVDAVLMPVNPVEGNMEGFLTDTLPAAQQKSVAIIGMKVLGASHYILPKFDISPELLIRYALSFDITLPIIGCSTPAEVRTLASVGTNLKPLSDGEKKNIEAIFKPYAHRLAFYRGVR
ncbi:putative oxidoreductase, aryl-alcohol dehydrogenase like protein [Desulfocapsa sulfexigens DSM 10523]|uniref:Putative oxidoreductase, aryl-alcohol dehydrogenase like protein n=1 Tax=Desulfocapsa sulfexigens (strain DSM 10523 / SB164P1) TaxID=1167006 RepID=M1NCY9_DESSD|nr:aldo/keto reductase [Desulfocapsa sulfexigens]AGF77619.1 putative oxidoreductase, aryl-alcohol dehydrogenase like protein [Desulfocapsa sulfexigens DSM 10523]